ncbi:hypothetical protein MMC18_001254 [Xylographa bjoerkii]|nr:hypothetical protein [Xylographa bjoerkii]
MDESDRTSEVWSLRSRASSVVSTGTKTSIGTLAHPNYRSESSSPECPQAAGIDVLLGHRNFRITARPGSVLSISSFDHPAPPYDAPLPTGTGHTILNPSEFETPDATSHLPQNEKCYGSNPPPNTSSAAEPSPPFRSSRSARSVHFASPIHSPSRSPPPSPSLSPTLPSPPTLSQHYTHVVRTIDANHRAEIVTLTATHTAALASTRNAIDAAYRVALRARDAEVENIRQDNAAAVAAIEARHKASMDAVEDRQKAENERNTARTAAVEELHKAEIAQERVTWAKKVEKARNEVEDMWESRWRDTMRVTSVELERLRMRVRELELVGKGEQGGRA